MHNTLDPIDIRMIEPQEKLGAFPVWNFWYFGLKYALDTVFFAGTFVKTTEGVVS
jgi:hypothetical protein